VGLLELTFDVDDEVGLDVDIDFGEGDVDGELEF